MVTIKDIYKSVCKLLTSGTNIIIADSDLEEPVMRPCFKVFMNTVKHGFYSSALRQIEVYFNIYYYAEDRGHSKSDIFDIENTLSFLFLEPLEIKDGCAVYIDDVEFEKVENGILNTSFSFEIATEFIDESDLENMEELGTNITVYNEE